MSQKRILSGDEAVAYAALAASVRLGAGYDEYRKDDGNHRHQRTERGD